MTRMTGPDCAVVCNLINIHTYIHIHNMHAYIHTEWHRITRMAGPDCAVVCNLIDIHTYTYILDNNKEAGGGAQDTQGSSKNCTYILIHTF